MRKTHIGVIGAGECSPEAFEIAHEVGRLVAQREWVLICGGLGGVMEGAAKGCSAGGGMAVGLLPGTDRYSANPYIALAIPTGMGEARNVLVVRASDVIVAIAGEYGTLSEIGFALKIGKPVVGLKTWPGIKGIDYVDTPQEAIDRATELVQQRNEDRGA